MLKPNIKNVDWVKVAKVAGYVCQGAAMVLGTIATNKLNSRQLDEFAKKHFEQMESK